MTSRRRFLGTTAVVGGISAASPAFSARSSIRYDELEARVTRRDFKNLHKEDLPTPCMVVDLEIFEKNLKTMADHCRTSGIHLRGHVKVHKSPDIGWMRHNQGTYLMEFQRQKSGIMKRTRRVDWVVDQRNAANRIEYSFDFGSLERRATINGKTETFKTKLASGAASGDSYTVQIEIARSPARM